MYVMMLLRNVGGNQSTGLNMITGLQQVRGLALSAVRVCCKRSRTGQERIGGHQRDGGRGKQEAAGRYLVARPLASAALLRAAK